MKRYWWLVLLAFTLVTLVGAVVQHEQVWSVVLAVCALAQAWWIAHFSHTAAGHP